MKIFMDRCALEKVEKGVANSNLSSLIKENKEQIADLVLKNINKDEKVEKVSIEASVMIGTNHFHEATFEKEVMSTLYRIYFSLRRAIHKKVSFRETVCGVILSITLTVVVSR